MNESKIAVRYSKALFQSARERKQLKAVRDDMLLILTLSEMEEFRDVIDSPVISNAKKSEVLNLIFRDNVSDISLSLINLTVRNNREAFLPGIARCFIDLADEHEGITKVKLRTAVPVSSENRKRITEIIERDLGTKTDLEEIIDEEIAGGYILKVEDLYVDASLKSQLQRIKKELIN